LTKQSSYGRQPIHLCMHDSMQIHLPNDKIVSVTSKHELYILIAFIAKFE